MQLDHKTKFRLENNLKGALAETLIREIFTNLNWKVYRFGMEYAVPGFGKRDEPLTNENALAIRTLPDFIIVKDTRVEYIEVKYRKNGVFNFKKEYSQRFGIEYPFPNTYFIIVTPETILIQQVKQLTKSLIDFVPLYEHPAFIISKETVTNYMNLFRSFVPVKEPEAIFE